MLVWPGPHEGPLLAWWMKTINLRTSEDHPEAVAEMRGPVGGLNFGLGLAVLVLHPQPLLYLALGSALLFMALGRLLSIIVDRGNTAHNWTSLAFETVMAVLPLAYALGFVA